MLPIKSKTSEMYPEVDILYKTPASWNGNDAQVVKIFLILKFKKQLTGIFLKKKSIAPHMQILVLESTFERLFEK